MAEKRAAAGRMSCWIMIMTVLIVSVPPPAVHAQAEPPVGPPEEVPDSTEATSLAGRPSPGGAFLRSILVPGWGQASSGAYGRAAFYVLAQAGSVWMTYKTNVMLDSTRRRQALLEEELTQELLARGVDPGEVEGALLADERIEDIRLLATARSEQLEDWVALVIFFVFFGGADAFVSAHLADFPVPLTVEPAPGPPGAGFEVGIALPWEPGR